MYNKATNALWVTYKNNAGIGAYLKGTITLNGNEATKVADVDPLFIDKNQYKTIIYTQFVDGTPLRIDTDNITANIYTLFGEGKKSLENVLEGQMRVESVQILENSMMNITDVAYDKGKHEFILSVKNIGAVDSYVSAEALDIYINGEYTTISSPEVMLVKVGKKADIPIAVNLTDTDIQNNPTVKVKIYYGERENSLINTKSAEYPFKLVQINYTTYGLVLLIVILLLLIIFGRKKCPHCKHKNSRLRKICIKCGKPLRSTKHEHVTHSDHDNHEQLHHEHHEEKKD